MKRYFCFLFLIVLTNCSNGLYDIWNSGGYDNPTLSPPVTRRESGDYFPFQLTFDNSSDRKIKYIISDKGILSYDANFATYNKPIAINDDCVVSAYCYTATEISPIVWYEYHILKETPKASVIVKPSSGELRWDQLYSEGIEWTDTIGNYDLEYWVGFDFDGDGESDYSINAGSDDTIVLSNSQTTQLGYNNCVVNISVDIRDKFGTLIMPGKISSYRYFHKKVLPNAIKSTVLGVSKDAGDYLIATAGPNSDNKMGINVGLYSFDYKEKMNFTIDSDFIQPIISITTQYKDNRGVVFFCVDSSVKSIYPIFNILSNGTHSDIGSGFEGESPFVFYRDSSYKLIYLKKESDKNSIFLREYDLNGVFKNEKVIIDNLSVNDRLASVDEKNGRYNIAIEYFNSVKLYKNYVFNSDFSQYSLYKVNETTEMKDFSTALLEDWGICIWNDGNRCVYQGFSLVDSGKSNTIVLDYPFYGKASIWSIDEESFGLLYTSEEGGANELVYSKVSSKVSKEGILQRKELITNDMADRSFIRLVEDYGFWIEENNPVMCRIF